MAGDNYVEQIEDVLRHCVARKGVAGFFAESIQGEVAVACDPVGPLTREN